MQSEADTIKWMQIEAAKARAILFGPPLVIIGDSRAVIDQWQAILAGAERLAHDGLTAHSLFDGMSSFRENLEAQMDQDEVRKNYSDPRRYPRDNALRVLFNEFRRIHVLTVTYLRINQGVDAALLERINVLERLFRERGG